MSAVSPLVNAFVAESPLEHGETLPLAAADTVRIAVERAGAARLAQIDAEWRDLLARAHETNVFMNPAAVGLLGDKAVTLLAWGSDGKLLGLWAFALVHHWQPMLPLQVLRSPALPHAYLATPVIDRAAAASVLPAMLDAVAGDDSLPKLIVLDPIRADGRTMHALEQVLSARGSRACILNTGKRPVLASTLDAKPYFEKAMSSSSRKKLRQHRRRLEEKGRLETHIFVEPDEIGRGFDDFLALEAAGWKGRRGTALACDQAEASLAKAMIAALAVRRDASIHALYQNGKSVASQVILRAGATAFTWKTAYDETLGEFSPGMLLLEDYTAAFLADKSIALVDSCAFDDSGFMSAWSEREDIAHVLIDARRGNPLSFRLVGHLQRALLGLRAIVKDIYLFGRRQWKGR
jgi:CelD/BcsL family acetyltransferase involved in cellulose biosynthesis